MAKKFGNGYLEQRLNEIYDHLYANAPVKTPHGIAAEVGKILRLLEFIEKNENNSARSFNYLRLNSLLQRPTQVICKEFQTYLFNNLNKFTDLVDQKINISSFDLYYVFSKLSGILISDSSRDVFGDAMEVFRSNWAKSHGGQFFTNQRVTHLAMILLQFNPLKGDDLIDICAGTGGFLLAGFNSLREQIIEKKYPETDRAIKDLATNCLKGQEIDKDVLDVANSTLASRMGKSVSNVVRKGDSILTKSFSGDNSYIKFNSHSCAATNPPFGTKITIKDPSILNQYELAVSNGRATKQTAFIPINKVSPKAPDILFIEQNIKLLKPGEGRLAIVVPFQIVSGPQTFFVREWILRNAQVLAVIDLPPETFQPYTGTKTSLLVLKRRSNTLENIDLSKDPSIFMSQPRWIGHDRRGIPTYKRNIDGTIADEILTDFLEVEESFASYLDGNNPSEVFKDSFVIDPVRILNDKYLRLDAHFHSKDNDISVGLNNKPTKNGKWKYEKIKNLVSKIFYPGRFTRHYVENEERSVPFLGGANITQLIVNTEKRLGLDNSKLDELKVEPNWILITRSGSTGIVSSVPEAWKGHAISEHVIRIIPDENKLSGKYLYAFLKTRLGQNMLAQGVYGSVIDEITPEFVGNIEIPIPNSNKTLQQIINKIYEGEKARQRAIDSLVSGIEELERELLMN